VAAKFFLNLDGAHRGINLNLFVEAMVVGLREILHKVARPGTAVTARRIEAGIEAQRFTRNNWLERSTGFERFELVIILNTGQFQAVDLRVLQEKRFVGRAEHRIPPRPVQEVMAVRRLVHGRSRGRKERAAQTSQQGKKN
jgi:hypothetical protein